MVLFGVCTQVLLCTFQNYMNKVHLSVITYQFVVITTIIIIINVIRLILSDIFIPLVTSVIAFRNRIAKNSNNQANLAESRC